MEEVLAVVPQGDVWSQIFSYIGIGIGLVLTLALKNIYTFIQEKITGKTTTKITWAMVLNLQEAKDELAKLTKSYKDNARVQFTRTIDHINNVLKRDARLVIVAILAKKGIKETTPKEIRMYEIISGYTAGIMLKAGMVSFEENGWATKCDSEWDDLCENTYNACKSEIENFFSSHWDSERLSYQELVNAGKGATNRDKYDATMKLLRKESIDYYKRYKELEEKIETLEKEMKG